MRSHKSSKPKRPAKAAWHPPVVTKLAIGTETKSVSAGKTAAARKSYGKTTIAHPQPPAAPTSKLGLSVELAFPLSSRFGNG
jgi:hypothetical protein